jgi:hypothetical protein
VLVVVVAAAAVVMVVVVVKKKPVIIRRTANKVIPAQNRHRWWAFLNVVINLQVP